MEILVNGKRYDEARLLTMKAYSDKHSIPVSTVNYNMLTGKLEVLKIGGVKFIVDSDDKND